ncbi:MAG: cation-translocating P-type ATPase, partial [Phycisphaerales bacterium]|nr:cation-translocating P-type ATPase [Phycisphaerales bacterium]
MVALDKTGTLTMGRIEAIQVTPIGPSDTDAVLRAAMAAEQRSSHPIAEAVVRLAQSRRLTAPELTGMENVPGKGIEGSVDGQDVRAGTFDFCASAMPAALRDEAKRTVDGIRAHGGMPVVATWGGDAIVIALADIPRPGATELARDLRAVGVSEIVMLTGDHEAVAARVGAEVGITNIRAGLLPEQKVEEVQRLRERSAAEGHHGLAMVGDGVNDAPALAVADVGLAMGAIGADAALETADVVLLHDDLSRVPWSIALARKARRTMVVNLAFAISVIALLATGTVFGVVPLGLGVIGHEGSTLIVVALSLRLLAFATPAPGSAVPFGTGETSLSHGRSSETAGPDEPDAPNVAVEQPALKA